MLLLLLLASWCAFQREKLRLPNPHLSRVTTRSQRTWLVRIATEQFSHPRGVLWREKSRALYHDWKWPKVPSRPCSSLRRIKAGVNICAPEVYELSTVLVLWVDLEDQMRGTEAASSSITMLVVFRATLTLSVIPKYREITGNWHNDTNTICLLRLCSNKRSGECCSPGHTVDKPRHRQMSSDEDSSDEPPELIAAAGDDAPVFSADDKFAPQLENGLYQRLQWRFLIRNASLWQPALPL